MATQQINYICSKKIIQTLFKIIYRLFMYLERLPGDVYVQRGEVLGQGEVPELRLHRGALLRHHHHAEGLRAPEVKLQVEAGEEDPLPAGVKLSLLLDAARLDQVVTQLRKPDIFVITRAVASCDRTP